MSGDLISRFTHNPRRSCRRLRSFDFDVFGDIEAAEDQKIAACGSSYGSVVHFEGKGFPHQAATEHRPIAIGRQQIIEIQVF